MGSDKPKKSCYHCTKRRIVCDLTEPKCNKCAKKGLECPGYGIRYRFADRKTASPVDFEPAHASSPPPPPFPSKRRQPDLKWVDVSSRVKRPRPAAAAAVAAGQGRGADNLNTAGAAAAAAAVAPRGGAGEGLDMAIRQRTTHASGPGRQYDNGGGYVHHGWCHGGGTRDTTPQDTVESSSTDSNDSDVVEITRTGDFDPLARADFSPTPIGLPYLLSNPDPRIRLLFKHFLTHVSPVMLMYDDEANGYRRQVLPLAHADPVVERAVCVAAAFHLSQRVPELRLPAESGRAAIVSKLSSEVDLGDSAWATLILLIVADLVTGHEHVLTLYRMLVAFLDARGQAARAGTASPLQKFLYNQSKLISLFAYPILGESKAVADFSKFLGGLMAGHERLKQRQRYLQSVEFMVSTDKLPAGAGGGLFDSRTYLYMEVTRLATEIYVLRASSNADDNDNDNGDDDDDDGGDGDAPGTAALPLLPGLDDAAAVAAQQQQQQQHGGGGGSMPERIAHIRGLFEQVDPCAPGSHTLAWPAFIAAAEARGQDDRDFFSSVMRRVWQSTGYANVLRGLDALPLLWERQAAGHKWTSALRELKTVVM